MKQPTLAIESRHDLHAGPPLPRGPLLGFLVAVLAVIVIAYFSYVALATRTATRERVAHTIEVMDGIQSLLSILKDAETGQRGFLLTGTEGYLEPFTNAKATLPSEFRSVRSLIADSSTQQQRLDTAERLAAEKIGEMGETIALRRAGEIETALAIVRTDRGRAAMDRIRAVFAEMQDEERKLLDARELEWQTASRFSVVVTTGGSLLLLFLIAAAAVMTSRDYRARETQAWLRTGQMRFSERIQGEQRLDRLGDNVLEFLATYLDAQVGAVHMLEHDGSFHRFAGYALSSGDTSERVGPGQGLLGQAAKENRTIHVRSVPEGYLRVSSSLGLGAPQELLVAPASIDGVVYAVIELGFFHAVRSPEQELLARLSESLGVAVRSSKDRTRLEALLEETQRQGEELQAQQEELRVSNEELEVQARALKSSQVQMEAQQAELEQTNAQLEEQAQLLENQKDELSQAQVVLTERATELERANQYKSEFLANMSHELRTPLNSTLILAKLLAENKQGNLTEEQVKFAQTICSAGNDLLILINDILDLSKIEAGKVDVHVESVILERSIDALTKSFQPLAKEKKLAFTTTIAPDAPLRMETDGQRLGQILKNLLANAFKFTEHGEVSLQVLADAPDSVSFVIRDTGIGIPAHQQAVIFDAFRQADGSTHRKYGGTGLGLSISRDLARLLGGELSVRSVPGEGSAFTLKLPVAYIGRIEAPELPAQKARPASTVTFPREHSTASRAAPANRAVFLTPAAIQDDREQLHPGGRLILIVEDDTRFAGILRDLAHEMSFQCVVTHSAKDALAAAAVYHPSAILLDINLPDHSGLGVLDQLKRDPLTRHIPVHVASAADFSHEALELGAIGYALKPVKREQLVDAFQRLEAKIAQSLRRVLVVEDDARQRDSMRLLLQNEGVEITGVPSAREALSQLQTTTYDCIVMDLNLPDLSGYDLLEQMAEQDDVSFPPVIIYTGRTLTQDEEHRLGRFSKSIIIKDARSPERLLDEVTLFLHQVEAKLPPAHQKMLQAARNRETALENRCILVVEDDVRNIFALSSLLEPKGAKMQIARNGKEAIDALARSRQPGSTAIDLVLMDIMMPEMDGLTAMREIRRHAEWKKLPIIALTAKAMKDDQENCLGAGANDYIAKPLDVEKLLSLIRVWMPK